LAIAGQGNDPLLGQHGLHAAKALEYPGWDLCGKATLSAATMRLLPEAAADADVLGAVAKSSYSPLVRGRLQPQAACLLLGLVAVTTLHADIGKGAAAGRGQEAPGASREDEQAPAERGRCSGATRSLTAPVESFRASC
jgi:hypothetical protein